MLTVWHPDRMLLRSGWREQKIQIVLMAEHRSLSSLWVIAREVTAVWHRKWSEDSVLSASRQLEFSWAGGSVWWRYPATRWHCGTHTVNHLQTQQSFCDDNNHIRLQLYILLLSLCGYNNPDCVWGQLIVTVIVTVNKNVYYLHYNEMEENKSFFVICSIIRMLLTTIVEDMHTFNDGGEEHWHFSPKVTQLHWDLLAVLRIYSKHWLMFLLCN